MPMMPAMKVVQPSKKKSQWNPAGFLRGNCLACAVKLLTFCGRKISLYYYDRSHGVATYMVVIK